MYEYTLITGACGGLGRAFSEALAERGESLLLTGRSAERLEALRRDLLARYPAAAIKTRACDLRDEGARRALFCYADGEGMTFRRLVYVAGVDTQMAFEKFDEARIVTQARVNLEGGISLMRGVLARAALDGSTELLAVGSMTASSPMPYFALYSATKKALEQFCVGLHAELKGRAKVTCVLPGGIPTREDIRKNIESHGLFGKISAKSPREVALASLAAVHKNKRTKVIGFWNHVIKFATDVAPMSVKLRFISKMWSKTEKDYYGEL